MSFHDTCQEIRIEVRDDHTVLLAGAQTADGEYVPAELVLDEGIGNGDGWFIRDGENFTQSAQGIELEFRDDGPWLTAELADAEGEYSRGRQGINLAEHIDNQDGQLVFIVS